MVVLFKKRSTLAINSSNNNSTLIKFSIRMSISIFSESPKVREWPVSLKDTVLNINRRRPIEVTEELVVLVDGTQLE